MTAQIISGKKISKEIKAELKAECEELKAKHDVVPGLSVIIVGEDPASQVYVKNKRLTCEKLGIKSFSYDLPVESAHPMTLIVTYYSDDRRGTPADFAILVDGQSLAQQTMRLTHPPRFFDVEYSLPPERVAGKTGVTIRFQAKPGSQIATVFGLRMIRADAPR